MTQRKWTPWEMTMIGEWVERTFGDVEYRTNVRVGRIQPRAARGTYAEDELAMIGVWRRFVDAVVILPDRLLLVEAVMRADPGKLSQLRLYEKLLPQTPELQEYLHLPVQKVLLYCIRDPALELLAQEDNILTVRYVPTFFDEWFRKLRPRDKRAPGGTL